MSVNKSLDKIFSGMLSQVTSFDRKEYGTNKKYKISSPRGEVAFSNNKAQLLKFAKSQGWC